MQNLTLDEQQALQSELANGESLVWAGKPNSRIIFHSSDWYTIPFSLLWGGFSIFWEAGVSGAFGFGHGKPAPSFLTLWGIPFVIMGQYFIWGRFLYAAWRKNRLIYAITDRRIIVVSRPPRPKTISAFIESVPAIDNEIRGDGVGTLKFGHVAPPWGGARGNSSSMDGLFLNSGIPVFVDIDDANSAYSIVTDQRERLRRLSHQER